MPKDQPRIPTDRALQDIADRLIPRFEVLPGENAALYQDFHDAIIADLAPGSAYGRLIVERLIGLEWELHRYRSIRDSLIRTEVAKRAEWALSDAMVDDEDIGGESEDFEGEHAEDADAHELPGDVDDGDDYEIIYRSDCVARMIALALIGEDAQDRAAAEAELVKHGLDPFALLAEAHAGVRDAIEPYERKIADLEIRCRRTREEYDRLKSRRRPPVEDAEIVDDD